MIQSILDFYPDAVSQYGLIGCAGFTITIGCTLNVLWRLCKAAVEMR